MQKQVFDRNEPFNELPLLPPKTEIDDDLYKAISEATGSENINPGTHTVTFVEDNASCRRAQAYLAGSGSRTS